MYKNIRWIQDMKHTTKIKVLRLLCMDDLNLIGKAEGDLPNHMQVAKIFSDDIHMEFGLEFCKDFTKETKMMSLTKLNTWFQQRNTSAPTGKTIQKPRG
jgi:hypothetical protein